MNNNNYEEENQYEKRITPKFIKKFLRSDHKLYYSTEYLNDCLYLHYKGFKYLEGLDAFTGLKVLYFEGNGIDKIQNTEKLVNLRCLYIQENCIDKMENLEQNVEIRTLNLTDNLTKSIEGLSTLTKLGTLLLKRNKLGKNGVKDLEKVLECPSISVLDIQDNYFDDDEIIQVLKQMPNLGVLYLQNNPVCKKIKNYRKTMIHNLPGLKYLDDRPIFEDEKRYVAAFFRGGVQEEREERKRYKKEQEEQHLENHRKFREMIKEAQAKHQQEKEEEIRKRRENGEEINEDTETTQQIPYQSQNNEQVPHLEDAEENNSQSQSNSNTQSGTNNYETYNTNTNSSQVSRNEQFSENSSQKGVLEANSDAESIKSVKSQQKQILNNLDELD